MKRKFVVCAMGVCLASLELFAQPSDWRQLATEGRMLERSGRYSEAAASYREAIRQAETSGGTDVRIVEAMNSLSLVDEQMGRFADAEYWSKRALALLAESDIGGPASRALLLVNQALIRREQGQIANADELLREAIAIDVQVLPPHDPNLMLARAAWAELVLLEQRYPEADKLIQESLVAFECQPLRWRREIATLLGDLALVRESQRRPSDAMHLLEDAVAVLEADGGADAPILLRPLVNIARIQSSAGSERDADANFRKAATIAERLGLEHPTCAATLSLYAAFLRHTGRKSEAKSIETKLKASLEASRHRGDRLTVDASSFRPR